MKTLVALLSALVLAQPSAAQITQSDYSQRREAIASAVGNGTIVVLGSDEPEQDYISFFQNSPFMYLTGLKEPGAALVIRREGTQTTSTVFVEPRDPAQEVWTGARLGPARAAATLGVAARRASDFHPFLDSLLRADSVVNFIGSLGGARETLNQDQQFVRRLQERGHVVVRDVTPRLNALRAVKSPTELDFIRKAVQITVIAEREAMRMMEPGLNEFEIQALIEYTFRRNGADRPSFSTIVGSGPNSTTLHYNADDRWINPGDMVVMDIGASYRGYSADVTRTIPSTGVFSANQRAIYQLVRDAQAAGERQAKPGALPHFMADSANAVLSAGLARLGLIDAANGTFDCDSTATRQCRQLTLYYMHGLGHGIGLDVHDPGAAPGGRSGMTPLVPGSAFTIEPGIYVRENLLDIIPDTPRNRELKTKIRAGVERYRNIGVRIEDDYITTPTGVEWVSRAPRELNEVEAMMREKFSGPLPRNPAIVEWYRATAPRGSAPPSESRRSR